MASMNACYTCKHRRDVPGDAHSRCVHPKINLNSLDMINVVIGLPNSLNVCGSAHGIRSGWFIWPLNFDPVWLENCDGYESTEGKSDAQTTDIQ
jgi:hypothetical protein